MSSEQTVKDGNYMISSEKNHFTYHNSHFTCPDYDTNKITITFPEYYLTGSTDKPTQKPDLPQGEYKILIYQTNTASIPLIKQPINLIQMPFNLTFYHRDHLGTTRYITNENGEILHTTDTLAYGEELTAPYENDKDEVLNTITFTGHEKDYETDLTYMLARYYSQGYGRFLSPDPGYDYDQLDPMSWNLYSYVRGNPIRFIDLTGMDVDEFSEIVTDSRVEYALKQHLDDKFEWGKNVYSTKGFFGVSYHIDWRSKWDKTAENTFTPEFNLNLNNVLTAHVHPGESPSFFTSNDVFFVMSCATGNKKGAESVKYGLMVSKEGSYGLEINVNKIPNLPYGFKFYNKVRKEMENLANRYSEKGMKNWNQATMKALFNVLNKYGLLKAVHFYQKDKNGKWVEIDPTRYLDKEGESK